MNEDEAFIRAIVDNPGDDTPRLVYADWLDDRDDLRGPYLRAEHEWAKPWRSGERPDGNPVLVASAVGLDPVWVARVSRPPVGVCCDHVRFNNRGAVAGIADIERVAQRLGGRFSTGYRSFLLNYNGGEPVPACLPYPVAAGLAWADMDLEIDRFNAASRPGDERPTGDSEIESERDFLEELYQMGGQQTVNPLIAGMVPIAGTIHDLGYLLVGIGNPNRGMIYHFRDYCHFSDDPNHLFSCAPTVRELLARLRPSRDF